MTLTHLLISALILIVAIDLATRMYQASQDRRRYQAAAEEYRQLRMTVETALMVSPPPDPPQRRHLRIVPGFALLAGGWMAKQLTRPPVAAGVAIATVAVAAVPLLVPSPHLPAADPPAVSIPAQTATTTRRSVAPTTPRSRPTPTPSPVTVETAAIIVRPSTVTVAPSDPPTSTLSAPVPSPAEVMTCVRMPGMKIRLLCR